jgi:excisionase family DNA binding protein
MPELLKPDEVAAYLGVSRNTIYRWCKSGDIESIKVRKTLRIQKSTLIDWIAEQERASCNSV